MALCENGLYDDLVEHFVHDNCACQKGRGTDYALKRMKMSGSKMGRERRRLTKLLRKEKAGAVRPGTAQASLISWEANAKRGDTFYQVKRMEAYYKKKARDFDGNESGKASQD